MLDVPAYFDRIGYRGAVAPAVDTLRLIHGAHLFTVPFENLDIGLGRRIECDEDAAVRKIVERKRGGFCY
ncbi:MAG TPA: arylamine N-acetyltransferase, partial [Terriglobales bacterium]|nr:arylamine N-acetyltransferase [Terriglobales bacterium]